MNYEMANGQIIEDEGMSEIMETLMSVHPHQSNVYTCMTLVWLP